MDWHSIAGSVSVGDHAENSVSIEAELIFFFSCLRIKYNFFAQAVFGFNFLFLFSESLG